MTSCDLISCQVNKLTLFFLTVLHAQFIRFISGVFALFSFFIVPIYRAITKNISESTCGKSNDKVNIETWLPVNNENTVT